MPEGDSLHRAALRLQVLVGQKVGVETPHPRAAAKQLAERLDGLVLESVAAVGKNLLLRFEGGHVLRSHLRMSGRWRVVPRGAARAGLPWLVLRGDEHEGVLWNGPVLELDKPLATGADILDAEPDYDAMVVRLRAQPARQIGDALLDQRLVAGIGNIWRAEALWEARLSPWSPIQTVSDTDLRATLEAAHRLMAASVNGARPLRRVYRRTGRACRRCGTPIRAHAQGDGARVAYWCPTCQRGGAEPRS
ncbi:MAG TPA: DNA-formamidopyrimidine glycosylase family protein [Gaiellaceae bacterium]